MPSKLRTVLANPIESGGILTEGTSDETIFRLIPFLKHVGAFDNDDLKFICVGDVVSKAFYSDPRLRKYVKYFIVDGETQRSLTPYDLDSIYGNDCIHVDLINHPRTISLEIMGFFNKTCRDQHQYILKIQGEEDLLAIPSVILKLPHEPHFVFYGQPPITDGDIKIPAGLVTLWCIPYIKQLAGKHLRQFETKIRNE